MIFMQYYFSSKNRVSNRSYFNTLSISMQGLCECVFVCAGISEKSYFNLFFYS